MHPRRHTRRDNVKQPFDREQIAATIQHSITRGKKKKIAESIGVSRQYFDKHFLGKGDDIPTFVFFEALVGFHGMKEADPEGFAAAYAFFDSLTTGGIEPISQTVEEILVALMQGMTELLKFRGKVGSRLDQVVIAARLQEISRRLMAKLSGPPHVNDSTLKMARADADRPRVEDALAGLKKAMKAAGLIKGKRKSRSRSSAK